MVPSNLYDMQCMHNTRIEPWNTYIRPWYFYNISNSSKNAVVDISVSIFPFFLIGFHIPPWCFTVTFSQGTKIGNLEVLLGFPFSPNLTSICILKVLYCQSSPRIQTWLHYSKISKVILRKICINFWDHKIPGKVVIRPDLGW